MATRRGFLGGLLGAGVAGPSMAKNAVANFASSQPASSYAYGVGNASTGAQYDHKSWLKEEFGRLTGLSLEEKRAQYGDYQMQAMQENVSALKSVSAQHRVRMEFDRRVEIAHAGRLKTILRDLAMGSN